ncbi:uncharacterized protein LOC126747856 [Anthonomus grandis grandis]|uniref:uncharacterized protein LOC126747856 n=1 Tax=Anthonomus grandis grandis TaxID=2921223 RepID=UPI002166BE7A|nr:uncharacterized protein LOC126747856 [Anthonomus grandis grandis]XP_050312716.1 uncharacterized protein LOC126747856 [Anthonomus grandis grandis]
MVSESSDSENEISNKELLKKIKKLERKIHKKKRRHRQRSGSNDRRSFDRRSVFERRSRTRSRSRSNSLRRQRDNRSRRGSMSRQNSEDRISQGSANHILELDDHSLRDVTSIEPPNLTEPRPASPELEIHNDVDISDDLIKILGKDPEQNPEANAVLHPALTSRWSHLLINGLEKEEKLTLLNKYVLPSNCEAMAPPEVNPEILNILSNSNSNRDKNLQGQQTQLSKGLVALSKGMEVILADKEIPKGIKETLLEYLSDSGRILTDLQYNITMVRRNLITPSLSKSVKEAVEKTKPLNFLFGSDLTEKVKEAKSLERTSKDLRLIPTTSQSKVQYTPTAYNNKYPKKRGGGQHH